MKSSALQPTAENILSSLINDSIGRNEDLRYFLKLLDTLEGSYALALDGGWGSGKTFFVQQAKLVLDCLNGNHHILIDKESELLVTQVFLQKNVGEPYKIDQTFSTVYYDAWIHDNQNDPIITLLYSFAAQLAKKDSEGKSRNYANIALEIVDMVTGKNFASIKKALVGENLFRDLFTEQMIQDKFSQLLNELLEERGDRLIVFVDELDRCSPAFAVKLLERVKHYLLDDRVVFIFSVNTAQLKHTVNHFYGVGFAADKYLDRFFDMVVRLPEPRYQRFFETLEFRQSQFNAFSNICHLSIKAFHLELREITRFIDIIKQYAFLMKEDTTIPRYGRKATDYFCIIFLLPVLAGLCFKDSEEFSRFIAGQYFDPLMQVYNDPRQGKWLARLLLNYGETLVEEKQEDDMQFVTVEKKIRDLYNAVFVHQYSESSSEINLGEYTFYADTKTQLMRSFGKLSPYAQYNNDRDV